MSENKKAEIRLARRILFGKQKPNWFIQLLTWFTIIWDLITILFFSILAVYTWIDLNYITSFDSLKEASPKFFVSFVVLHVLSLISAILLYRLKKTGLYLYCISNLVLLVLPYFYLKNLSIEIIPIGFTLVLIGLWATQYKLMK